MTPTFTVVPAVFVHQAMELNDLMCDFFNRIDALFRIHAGMRGPPNRFNCEPADALPRRLQHASRKGRFQHQNGARLARFGFDQGLR